MYIYAETYVHFIYVKRTKHVSVITMRLWKCFFIFKELRDILDVNNLRTLHFAQVQSVLTHGITSWGSVYKNTLEPLTITRRVLVRVNKEKLSLR